MSDPKSEFKKAICTALQEIINEKNLSLEDFPLDKTVVQDSPDASLGDFGSPMFVFAKSFRTSPQAVAEQVASIIQKNGFSYGEILNAGPYVNLKLNKSFAIKDILQKIKSQGSNFGKFNIEGKPLLEGHKIMI